MKLVAIWVEGFKNLKDIGFNLGDELFFNFKFSTEENKLQVDFEDTVDYFNPHSGKKISNLSAILGINGSGKSTLLNLLKLINSEKPVKGGVVLVFKSLDRYKVVSYEQQLSFKNIPFKVVLSDKIIKENLFINKFDFSKSQSPFENIDLVFYSNEFSNYDDSLINKNDKLNISVNYLTRKSLTYNSVKKYCDNFKKQQEMKESEHSIHFDILNLYFSDRLKKQHDLLIALNSRKEKIRDFLNFIPLPEKIDIKFNDEFYPEVLEFADKSVCDFSSLRAKVLHCVKQIDQVKRAPIKRFKKEMTLRLFLYAFYRDLFNTTKPRTSLDEIEKFIRTLKADEHVFDNIYSYMITKEAVSPEYEISILVKLLKNIHEESYGIELNQYLVFDLFVNYDIQVNKKLWKILKDFNSLFQYDNSPFLLFNWHGLSAGEEALLTLFSEIWSALKSTSKETVVICIDEGELYIHPEWQRQYVDYLINFLEFYMKRKRKIKSYQIILTSHSPFIAGDIPKYNLVFLNKEERTEENTKPTPFVVSSQKQPHTFGGNIFDLYKKSFFINDFFGEYSKKWMNEAFNKVNNQNSVFENEEELKKFVRIIGEPIIRDTLLSKIDLFNSKSHIQKNLSDWEKE